MANKNLFQSTTSRLPRANTRNEAGGRAYNLEAKHALAQLAATGCFNGSYYANAETQLATLQELFEQVDDNLFLAKLAVYSRQKAYMKDMPAALLLLLSKRDNELFHVVFDRIVDNGRVLRTLLQMLRSGQFGRRSLSYSLQRAFQRWLNDATVGGLLSASIGNDPSLRDVLRLARPTPANDERRALFGWLTDRPVEKWSPATWNDLPSQVKALIAFRRATTEADQIAILENNRFRWDLLADSALGPNVWKAIARQMGHQALRMNLNTLKRHDVFQDRDMVKYVANRLSDEEEIGKARQFPYQYFSAYQNAAQDIPVSIRTALSMAAETACGNVPKLPGPVVIGVDTSGSMMCPITGYRRGASTAMRCVDAAALFAAAIVRRNPKSVVVPFDNKAYKANVTADQTILQVAKHLSSFGGGGTNCALPLAEAYTTYKNHEFVGCVLVSDMESWIGTGYGGSTGVMTEWNKFVKNQRRLDKNANPKLICINLQAYTTTQAPEREEILNVGGFSDAVFNVVASFLDDDKERFVREVERIELAT
ncbi:MAG: TROVE domain-containing protein [Gemmataceae bacterium]